MSLTESQQRAVETEAQPKAIEVGYRVVWNDYGPRVIRIDVLKKNHSWLTLSSPYYEGTWKENGHRLHQLPSRAVRAEIWMEMNQIHMSRFLDIDSEKVITGARRLWHLYALWEKVRASN